MNYNRMKKRISSLISRLYDIYDSAVSSYTIKCHFAATWEMI